jgi:hypothetical protein
MNRFLGIISAARIKSNRFDWAERYGETDAGTSVSGASGVNSVIVCGDSIPDERWSHSTYVRCNK